MSIKSDCCFCFKFIQETFLSKVINVNKTPTNTIITVMIPPFFDIRSSCTDYFLVLTLSTPLVTSAPVLVPINQSLVQFILPFSTPFIGIALLKIELLGQGRKCKSRILCNSTVAIFLSTVQQRCTLYSVDSQPGRGASNLYLVNQNNGSAQLIGPLTATPNSNATNALAFQPSTGILYGISSPTSSTGFLLTIDRTTAITTIVAPINGIILNGATNDMSFRPTNGMLYALNSTSNDGSLYTVNLTTGTLTLVGTPITFANNSGNGLTFDNFGRLFLVSSNYVAIPAFINLYQLNPDTGAILTTTPVTFTGTDSSSLVQPRISALVYSPCTNLIYANVSSGSAGGGGHIADFLGTIDTATGVVTLLGLTALQTSSLAILVEQV
jgi:hypothetical protein